MKLKIKHDKANRLLYKLALKHSDKKTINRLAKLFDVSGQTILNYLHGRGKDGFLKMCIIDELNLPAP